MTGTPYVSVVIDNHNYGRYLGQAVESVLAQDFPSGDVEIIVADDGSTDDSREILSGYGGKVRTLLLEHRGQAETFNAGFSAARGEIVCLLDSDDVWLPGKLAAIAPLFDDRTVGGVQHYLTEVAADLAPIREGVPSWPGRYRLEDFLGGRTHFTATSGLAFRSSVLRQALPIPADLFFYLDTFLTIRALFVSELANCPRALGLHRLHGRNWCASGLEDPRKIEFDFRMRDILRDKLGGWLSEFGRTLSPRYLEIERLELSRRRVLLAALRGDPGGAWAAWLKAVEQGRMSSFAAFRLATLLLAVLSPTLYLTAYSAYAESAGLQAARARGFPEEARA